MSYYARGQGDEADFDEYDSTPYSGGYDIRLTYGQPLSPSGDICYPPSTSSRQCDVVVDSDRPTYSSSSQPSAYAGDALDNEYRSYSRPLPRPRPPPPSYGGPPEYGFGPPPPGPPPPGPPPPEFEMRRPGYRGGEFRGPGPEFRSGFGRPDQEYGSREYEKPRHGHKKHGGNDDSSDDNSDDSDEEKKQRHHGRRHQHHHHGGYDD